MRRRLKIGRGLSNDTIGWISLGVTLLAIVILDRGFPPYKWHAGIIWTVTAFYGAVIFGRSKWQLWSFWVSLSACMVVHIILMWAIFGQLLPGLRVGTLYVIPLGFAESILLLVVVARLARLWSTKWSTSNAE